MQWPYTLRDARWYAPTDNERALALARAVEDPWFACQDLAIVARFGPEERVETIVEEVLAVGRKNTDPYRVVGSAAHPVRALIERDRVSRLDSILPGLLEMSQYIANPASRSEALFTLFQAVLPAGRRWWEPVLTALMAASDPAVHWRQRRNAWHAVIMIARNEPELASKLLQSMNDERTRRKLRLALERNVQGWLTARPFFWREDVDENGNALVAEVDGINLTGRSSEPSTSASDDTNSKSAEDGQGTLWPEC